MVKGHGSEADRSHCDSPEAKEIMCCQTLLPKDTQDHLDVTKPRSKCLTLWVSVCRTNCCYSGMLACRYRDRTDPVGQADAQSIWCHMSVTHVVL